MSVAPVHQEYNKFHGSLIPCLLLSEPQYETKLPSVSFHLTDQCTVRVNFWGKREIVSKEGCLQGPMEPVSLDWVAKNIFNATNQKNSPSLGLCIQQGVYSKLATFYTASDTQRKNSNFLTKLFNYIRENLNPFLLFGTSIRRTIEDINTNGRA